MPTRRQLILTTPTLAMLGCGTSANPSIADVVLMNVDIHTVNANRDHAQALAISGNKILAVGTNKEVKEFAGTTTRIFDLDGRTVLPGINDSHLHLLMWGMSKPPFSLDVTFPAVKTIAHVVAKVKQAAANRPTDRWIIGRGWDQAYLGEGRAPTAADLDAVAPNHPVALTDFSGHAIWANSKAMEIVGINADTVPPPGGVIVKDGQGQPTGLLFEGAAWMIRGKIPEPTEAENRQALQGAMQLMLQRGVTSCTIPGQSIKILTLLNQMAAEDFDAKLRVVGMLRSPDSLEGLQTLLPEYQAIQSNNPLWLQLDSVKIMGDGIPTGNKTAWLHSEYVGGGNGNLLILGNSNEARAEELRHMIDFIHSQGLQIGTHVTGDKSIDTTIQAYQAAQIATQRSDPRHYIIHGDLVPETTLATMAQEGIGANFNPEIKHLIADSQVFSIGPKRAAYEWPYRSAVDAGVVTASSSDAPVTEGNWLQGIATCVDRLGKQSGQVSGPAQRITLEEAIWTYTWAGAWQDHAETYKGSLEAGKMADLCVVDERLSNTPTTSFAQAKVCLTLVDGKIVHNTLGA
ncbi:MAG: amidohydrolase [Pseudomonadota bacterium]